MFQVVAKYVLVLKLEVGTTRRRVGVFYVGEWQ